MRSFVKKLPARCGCSGLCAEDPLRYGSSPQAPARRLRDEAPHVPGYGKRRLITPLRGPSAQRPIKHTDGLVGLVLLIWNLEFSFHVLMLSRPARCEGCPAGFSSRRPRPCSGRKRRPLMRRARPSQTPMPSSSHQGKTICAAAGEVGQRIRRDGEERLWRRLRAERMTSENEAGFATCELTKEDPQVAIRCTFDKRFEPSRVFARNSERSAAERASRPAGFVSKTRAHALPSRRCTRPGARPPVPPDLCQRPARMPSAGTDALVALVAFWAAPGPVGGRSCVPQKNKSRNLGAFCCR